MIFLSVADVNERFTGIIIYMYLLLWSLVIIVCTCI